jgi:hypothetical protein
MSIEKEFMAEECGVDYDSLGCDTPLTKEDFIVKVLSVRAPWGYWFFGKQLPKGVPVKDIENRTRRTNYRGEVFIQIPNTIEFGAFDWMCERFDIKRCDIQNHFMPGHIIGHVEIVDCVQDHSSPWAMDAPWHWVIDNPVLLNKPIPCKGQLGIYNFELPIMLTASDFQERNVYRNHITSKGK